MKQSVLQSAGSMKIWPWRILKDSILRKGWSLMQFSEACIILVRDQLGGGFNSWTRSCSVPILFWIDPSCLSLKQFYSKIIHILFPCILFPTCLPGVPYVSHWHKSFLILSWSRMSSTCLSLAFQLSPTCLPVPSRCHMFAICLLLVTHASPIIYDTWQKSSDLIVHHHPGHASSHNITPHIPHHTSSHRHHPASHLSIPHQTSSYRMTRSDCITPNLPSLGYVPK